MTFSAGLAPRRCGSACSFRLLLLGFAGATLDRRIRPSGAVHARRPGLEPCIDAAAVFRQRRQPYALLFDRPHDDQPFPLGLAERLPFLTLGGPLVAAQPFVQDLAIAGECEHADAAV